MQEDEVNPVLSSALLQLESDEQACSNEPTVGLRTLLEDGVFVRYREIIARFKNGAKIFKGYDI